MAFSASQFPSKTPPPRPSREGTPRLDDVVLPSPVIHSNLSRLETTGHKRRESLEKPLFHSENNAGTQDTIRPSCLEPSGLSDRSRLTKPSRLPSSNPNMESPQTRPGQKTPHRTATHEDSRSRNTSRGSEPSPINVEPSKSVTRFGLFSRRTSPVRIPTSEDTDKPVKKGPAAGTGHEGYGKYARRGRSGSAGTSTSRGRSSSSNRTTGSVARTPNSRKSSFTSRDEPEIDDFLRDRLNPVIISGGRVSSDRRDSGGELYRTTSGASSASIISSDDSSQRNPALAAGNRFAGSTLVNSSTTSSRRASKNLPRGHGVFDSATSSGAEDGMASRTPNLASRR
ncbi:MAG: hypothetical protein Q9224_007044, partial [Gallowayella concinna]